MLVLYLLLFAATIFGLTYDFDVTPDELTEIRIYSGIFLPMCVVVLAFLAVGLFLPRRPWGWVYGLVLLGLGATSFCTWPITIPLLIQWVKPEMKARFAMR